jgi:Domain of unknown function (DUF4342)
MMGPRLLTEQLTCLAIGLQLQQRDEQTGIAGNRRCRKTGAAAVRRRSMIEEVGMTEKSYYETFSAQTESVINKIKALIHEGNVRRVVVQHQGRTVAEFPLTAGVVGAMLAPVLAAIGALVALLQDCTIQVERDQVAAEPAERREAGAR